MECAICGKEFEHNRYRLCPECSKKELHFDGIHCVICGVAISQDKLRLYPNSKTCSTKCQKILQTKRSAEDKRKKKFTGNTETPKKFCIVCKSEISVLRLKRFPNTLTCSPQCTNIHTAKLKRVRSRKYQKELRAKNKEYDVLAIQEQEKIEKAAKHLCHGWIDTYGKKHPCNRKTTNYRCDSCWSKMRSSVVDDTDE